MALTLVWTFVGHEISTDSYEIGLWVTQKILSFITSDDILCENYVVLNSTEKTCTM